MTTRDEIQYDVRTLERKIRKGIINRKDFDKYLKNLPDRTENIAPPEETEQGDAASDEAE